MRVHFTRHAKSRMRWRNISKDDVMRVLDSPDSKGKDSFGHTHFSKKIRSRKLRVTIAKEKEKVIVITVVDKSK